MSEQVKELGASHTPGPWTDGREVLIGGCSDAGLRVGMVLGSGASDESRANARLIAAAPELLEALKPFAAYAKARAVMPIRGAGDTVHRIHPGTEWEAEITVADCDAALAAISKAEGAS